MDFVAIKKRIYNILINPFSCMSIRNRIILKKNKVNYSKLKVRGKLYIINRGRIDISHDVVINSSKNSNALGYSCTAFEVGTGASLLIHNNVGISNATIRCENKVEIEENTLIGGGVTLIDSNCHSLDWNIRQNKPYDDIETKPILIKKSAFIGAESIILKGVTVGEKAVIGAGSVVTCDIPEGELWAGNPARFIRKL